MLCALFIRAIRVIRVQYFTTNFTNLTNVVCVIYSCNSSDSWWSIDLMNSNYSSQTR